MPDVDIPNEVASTSFLNQTTALSSTTLFTPSAAGNFRVSIYTSAASNPNVTVTVSWTDAANGANSVQFTQISTITSSKNNYGIAFLRSAASSAIQISATLPTVSYDLFSVVEQL
jgi:hypothetical protein